MSELITETVRVARREHRCQLCRGTIRVGYEYSDERWVEDGTAGVYTARRHQACIEFARELGDEDFGWDEYTFADLAHDNPEADARRRHRLAMQRPGRTPVPA